MSRKKAKDQSALFTCSIRTRVTEAVYNRLNAFVGNGDCHSIGEVARRILSKEKILCTYRDTTMDATVEQLALIRKELNAIGININQMTRYFNSTEALNQKAIQALKVAEQYARVGDKVDELLKIIGAIAKKWLQK
ncbi:MAG TPA: plasmid mobilization relaxosome protein MobC [Cyclobacteriaceae bacterium]|nr:plasmid mobilization relaxosome protein MobC [Cyclobacteriaceae bacterium]